MLYAVPKHWFSWDFHLRSAGDEEVAEILLSSWRERGAILLGREEYRIHREGLTGPFLLESSDSVTAARAVKTSMLYREFILGYKDRNYTLKAISPLHREFGLFAGENRIGSIRPESWFGRRAIIEFTDELPLLIQVFSVWLAFLLWKREADSA
jgi:hypothetical protein